MRRPQLSYANVMSSIAVFLALGGTSYAVAKNSIGEKQLKSNAVTSPKIKDGAVTAADLAPGTAISGPRGPRGEQGPAGAKGDRGTDVTREAWKELPFTTGWVSYAAAYDPAWQPAEYRKDSGGRVELRGLVTRISGTPTAGAVIAVLPPGYRPRRGRIFLASAGEPPSAGRVVIYPDGAVTWNQGNTGEADYTSLEGIAFDVD